MHKLSSQNIAFVGPIFSIDRFPCVSNNTSNIIVCASVDYVSSKIKHSRFSRKINHVIKKL